MPLAFWGRPRDHRGRQYPDSYIFLYSYISQPWSRFVYPNPDPDSYNSQPWSWFLYPKHDPDSYILTLILMTIFILNLIPPGGRNEPFHPVGASWWFEGVGHPSPQHWCYPSRGHQVTFCVPATIIVISDGVKSHLYIDFHTYTRLFKVFSPPLNICFVKD